MALQWDAWCMKKIVKPGIKEMYNTILFNSIIIRKCFKITIQPHDLHSS